MSQADVEVVARCFAAYSERGVDGLLECLDPEIEWQSRIDLPDADLYRGHDGVRRLNERFEEDLEGMYYELEELIDAGDGLVVFVFHWGGTGRGSGARVESRDEAWLFRVSGSNVIRVDEYRNKQEAMEAARVLA